MREIGLGSCRPVVTRRIGCADAPIGSELVGIADVVVTDEGALAVIGRAAAAEAQRARHRRAGSRMPGRHELSQKAGRHDCGGGSVARRIMTPPQHGHRSWDGLPVSGSLAGRGAAVLSSRQQSASLAAR